MPTFANGESAATVRTKINDAIDKVDGNAAITSVNIDGGAIDGVTLGTNSAVTEAQIDNININGNAIISTNTNGNIALTPNGTGEVDISKVDIDGGTIDGTTIGGASAAAATFTNVTANGTINFTGATVSNGGTVTTIDIDGGSIDGTTIGGSSPAVGTFTTANATTVDTTNLEVTTLKAKDGTSAGSIADSTGVVTLASSVLTTTDINGGSIDGTTIGAASAAAGTFTTVTASGDVTIADKIVHSGDTDTSIRFPAADTVTVETSGTERLRIDSSGNVGIGTSSPSYRIDAALGNPSSSTLGWRMTTGNIGNLFLGLSQNSTNLGAASTSADIYTTAALDMRFGTNSTERMRIDASGNVGIGTTDPTTLGGGSKLTVNQGADGNIVFARGGSTRQVQLGTSSTMGYINVDNASGGLGFNVNTTERMRIDASGNVGIGTSSPSNRLHVQNEITTAYSSSNTLAAAPLAYFYNTNGSVGGAGTIRIDGGTSGGNAAVTISAVQTASSSSALTFGTRSGGSDVTERMRIDASGNLGLGVTPSGWASGQGAMQFKNGGLSAWALSGVNGYIYSNAYYDGSTNRYINNGFACSYAINNANGIHAWFNAPSGTAGNAITFTQAMTLDASGNLLVGTTSQLEAGAVLNISGGSIAHASTQFNFRPGSGVQYELVNRNGAGFDFYTNNASVLAARIDSSGRFFVGTTSGSSGLNVSAAGSWFNLTSSATSGSFGTFYKGGTTTAVGYIGTDGGGIVGGGSGDNFGIRAESALILMAGATERARIDSDGRFLVGTTSFSNLTGGATAGCAFQEAGTVWGARSNDVSGAFNRIGSDGQVVDFRRQGTIVGNVSVTTTATSFNTSSDYRLKEDLQPMTGASERVLALKPVNFAWKADGSRTDGFIAHEVQEVAPYAVTGEKDGEQMQGMDHSKLVPLLTAALQEALTKIEALEARITALEA